MITRRINFNYNKELFIIDMSRGYHIIPHAVIRETRYLDTIISTAEVHYKFFFYIS